VTTFALIHGAWHGGWAFDDLVRELRLRGHDAVAPDLPCEDPAAGAARYSQVVDAAIPERADDLVVVAHSLGGLTAPLVAERRPVQRLVFLCGLLPVPGRPLSDRFSDPDLFLPGPGERTARGDDGLSRWLSEEDAIAAMYADCDPARAAAAAARLRGQAPLPSREDSPLTAWPNVPCSYLLCTGDMMVGPAWSRRVCRQELGIEPIEWEGSHSPMLARPAALADLLSELAQA
jgi:pimeloyl-ACP methyl ester carboxylesterase